MDDSNAGTAWLRWHGPGHPPAPAWPEGPNTLPVWSPAQPPRHLHLLPSLSLGGAERIVVDLAAALSDGGAEADVVVLRPSPYEHVLAAPGIAVHRLGGLAWPERIACAAGLALASRLPAFCHLTSLHELAGLWAYGVRTVPVVHNVRQGWKEDPRGWDVPQVPFVVACGDQVAADLRAAGLRAPVRVLRHVVPVPAAMAPAHRDDVRRAMGAGPETLLIGMAGRLAPQKNYGKAVRVLARLVQDGCDARLVIVGAASGEDDARCRAKVAALARRMGVRHHLVLVGAVAEAARLVPAYDVFLNTSLWEGVSVATMEADAACVPVVGADVGGQREAIGAGAALLPAEAPDAVWAAAVRAAAARSRGPGVIGWHDAIRRFAATAWPWLLALGPDAVLRRPAQRCDVLFVTGSMDVGGAQRSLCNLVAEWPAMGLVPVVAVCGPAGVPGFMAPAQAAGVRFLEASGIPGPLGGGRDGLRGRAGRVLALVQALCPRTVCFWNMDAVTKVAVAAVLSGGPVRVADVSPGPMLYAELAHERDSLRLLSSSPARYLASLDLLVSKYAGEVPPARPRRHLCIPNGVPAPGPPLPDGDGPAPPAGADPALAIVTVGRLDPDKRPELLPLVARALHARRPGATLTAVGGTHEPGREGWAELLDACDGVLPSNLQLAGPDHRTTGFLPRFAVFYMVSRQQGCPNASLEAMACGLPVVANPDGGTAEQAVDGVTGLLVEDCGCAERYAGRLADALCRLLDDPARAATMGRAARDHVRARFSMAAMADAYRAALLDH